MTDPNQSAQSAERPRVDRPSMNSLASARHAYRRLVEAFGGGVAAAFRGPSAEGITLYAGLASHQGNGSIPEIVNEAITTLAADAEPSKDDD